jgi:hypothetical protein
MPDSPGPRNTRYYEEWQRCEEETRALRAEVEGLRHDNMRLTHLLYGESADEGDDDPGDVGVRATN